MLNEGCLNGTEPSTRNAQGVYVNPEYAAELAAEDAAEAAKTRQRVERERHKECMNAAVDACR